MTRSRVAIALTCVACGLGLPAWRHVLGATSATAQAGAQPAPPDAASARYAAAIAQVERLIAHEMQDKGLPALSIAMVDERGIVYAKGFGAADPARKQPATADTIYRVGSVSKLFTDIAVMQLVERGELDLDKPVTTWLRDFKPVNPFGTPITLRHLMSHRAGLVREPPVGHYFDDSSPSLAQTVASLNKTTLVYAPGTRTKYSNAGIAVVGRVLEVVTKQRFADALQQRVIAPLDLRHSTFTAPKLEVAKAFMWTYHGTQFDAPTFALGMAPAGSLSSSVTDLARFAQVLFNRGQVASNSASAQALLKPETLEAMWTPQFVSQATATFAGPGPLPRPGYGLGFDVSTFEGQRRVGHSGAIYGFATELQVLPDRKLGVAISTTLDSVNPVMTHLAQGALRAMLRVQDGRPQADVIIPQAVSPEDAARLDGHYAAAASSPRRELTLRARGGRLIASIANIQADVKAVNTQLLIDGRLAYGAFLTPRADGTIEYESRSYRKVDVPKPAAPRAAWTGLIGEYGWDHDVLYIFEQDGKLHALIQWFYDYPLEQVGPDRFAFPKAGLYDGEQIRFIRASPTSSSSSQSHAAALDLSGVRFPRRPVGLTSGTFRITPLKPLASLRAIASTSTPPAESGKRAADLVELSSLDPTIKYDIRYATTNNFMSTPFYRQARALMQRPAAEAVVRAHHALKAQGFGLLIHDAYRPWAVTKMFWEATPIPQRVFVADPSQGSRHNRGCAVDLTLYDLATGKPIQMVGGYDEFSDRSYPDYPGGTSLQRWHRDLLRRAMEAEGFTVFDAEWWHFDFKAWREYPILNVPFEQLPSATTARRSS